MHQGHPLPSTSLDATAGHEVTVGRMLRCRGGPGATALPAGCPAGRPQTALSATPHLTFARVAQPAASATETSCTEPVHRGPPTTGPRCPPAVPPAREDSHLPTEVPWKESSPPANLHVEMTRSRAQPVLPETGDQPRGDQLLHRDGRPTPGCTLEGKECCEQPPRNLPRWLWEAGYLVNVGYLPPEGPQTWCFPRQDQVPGFQTGAHFLFCSPLPGARTHTQSHTHSRARGQVHTLTHTLTLIHACTPTHNHMLMDTLTR